MNKQRIKGISMFLVFMVILCFPVLTQIDQDYWENLKKAFAAHTEAECRSALSFCLGVLKEVPHNPIINYLAARSNEQLGKREAALQYLMKATRLGYTSSIGLRRYVHPVNDPVFCALRKSEAFTEIRQIMANADKVIHKGQIAFTVNDERMGYYEGITYDPKEKMFYLGSDNKIFKVDHTGKSIVFTGEAEKEGLHWVNGVHIDAERRILWACSNDHGRDCVDVFKYNLATGKMIKKYGAPNDGKKYMFNDCAIHDNGDVYISGSSTLFRIPHDTDKLEIFFKNRLFVGSNGITLSDDGNAVYVADDANGIWKIDITTKNFFRLNHPADVNTHGIDGLYFRDNNLYAIHNSFLPMVCRFRLDKHATRIESCEYFEKNIPLYGVPCTGVLVDDCFYFLAGYNVTGVIVMRIHLKQTNSI